MAGGLCLVTVLLVTLGANAVSGVTIPAVPGSTITLSCNKIPSTNLIWEHWDSKRIIIRSGVVTNSVTSSKYVVTQRQDSESVAVSSVTLSDDGQYRCYYSTSPADAQVMNINVLVRPQTVYASGPTDPVSQATIQILTCEVKVAKPLPEVKWIRKDYGGNFTEFAGTNQDWYFQNKTGSRVNTLRVNVTRKAYKAVFICQAAISYFYTIQFNVTLDVFCKITPLQTLSTNYSFFVTIALDISH
ncbi:cell adhesion molecule 2-like [Liolophura sinensis]|uniref:cell adhesion molecule 2-like n=1 Tax=Liolophura sinensis TaxID=3198878 RepID=UPI0031580315